MHRIRPKGRLFDDDNNPSLPDEDKSYAGDLVCCMNGKTPAEYKSDVDADDFSIVEDVPNGKTTWTTLSTISTITWEIHFIACCASKIRFEYTSGGNPDEFGEFPYPYIYVYVRKPTDDNAFDYVTDSTLIYEGEAATNIDIQLEEQAGAEDFFPAGVCGTHVWIDVHDADYEGEVLSFTLE